MLFNLILKFIFRRFKSLGFGGFAAFLAIFLLSACGGGGGNGLSMGSSPDSLLASQIAEVQPDNDQDTSRCLSNLPAPAHPLPAHKLPRMYHVRNYKTNSWPI